MFGSSSVCRNDWIRSSSIVTTLAPLVWTDDRARRRGDRLAVGLGEDVVDAAGDAVDAVGVQGLLGRVRLRVLDRADGPGDRLADAAPGRCSGSSRWRRS